MISRIDIAIMAFIFFNMIRGYMTGFSRSLFLSVRFIGAIVLTRLIYINYFDILFYSSFYQRYKEMVHDMVTRFMSVFIYSALEMDTKIFAISIFIIVTVILNIVFYSFHFMFSKRNMKQIDKFMGLIFGAAKSVVYIMILIAIVNPMIQKFAGFTSMDALSDTRLLKYFYSYNFIMGYFKF